MLLFAGANGHSGEIDVPPNWEVRSYLDQARPLCEKAGISLVLRGRDGALLAAHKVPFSGLDDTIVDSEWSVAPPAGTYSVELRSIDCGGVETRAASLDISIDNSEFRRQFYVFAEEHNRSIAVRYLEIDTFRDATGVLTSRRKDRDIVVRNISDKPVELCRKPLIFLIRHEYLVGEEWGEFSHRLDYDLAPEIATIPENGEVVFEFASAIVKWSPESVKTPPDDARIKLAVRPQYPNHVKLGPMPEGIHGFPGCDFYFVKRVLSPNEFLNLDPPETATTP
jgi:hypothetical protein